MVLGIFKQIINMKHIISIIILLTLPLMFSNSKNKILVMKEPLNPLLYQVLWGECSICNDKEIRFILDCIKNRIKHEDFPNSLDAVLNQSLQFSPTKVFVPKYFRNKIEILWEKPVIYPYLYFRSNGYEESDWMLNRDWIKHKHFKHEFS
jgi:hypothetical protein